MEGFIEITELHTNFKGVTTESKRLINPTFIITITPFDKKKGLNSSIIINVRQKDYYSGNTWSDVTEIQVVESIEEIKAQMANLLVNHAQ